MSSHPWVLLQPVALRVLVKQEALGIAGLLQNTGCANTVKSIYNIDEETINSKE